MGVVKVLGERLPGTLKSPIYDLDYERNRGFFHYFLKIRRIMKKTAIFYTIKEGTREHQQHKVPHPQEHLPRTR